METETEQMPESRAVSSHGEVSELQVGLEFRGTTRMTHSYSSFLYSSYFQHQWNPSAFPKTNTLCPDS